MSPYNSGKAGGQAHCASQDGLFKVAYLGHQRGCSPPLDVSHGLEWAMGTGPWGRGNWSRSQHRPSGPGARN